MAYISLFGLERINQLFERQGLMIVRLQYHFPHQPQQFAEFQVSIQLRTQHYRVDKESDQLLSLSALTAGNGRADDDVGLSCIAIKKSLERSQQGHEQGDAFTTAQLFECITQTLRESYRRCRAAPCSDWWTRMIGRQLQHRLFPSQLLEPVPHLFV